MSLIEDRAPRVTTPRRCAGRSSDHRRLVQFITRVGVLLSLGWLVLVTVAAVFAPWVAPYDPNAQNLANTNAGISTSHWLGTDDLGRDVLSRLIYGSRISMQITFETVGIALVLALVLGLVAGYRGGRIDYLLMRGADAGLAFPPLILALAVVAVLGSGVNDVALAFALVFAPGFARFIRGQTLAVKEESFVEASTSIGTPPARIVLSRILPNVLTGLTVGIAIALGAALLTSSGLSFLGLGPPPPAASWGSMLEEAYNTALFTHPWSLVPSGLVIAVTVLAFNTLGDAMRDTVSGAATKGRSRHRRTQRGLTVVSQPAEPARDAAAAAEEGLETHALLEVRGLCIEFDTDAGPVRVVDEVSFEIGRGKIVGLVGESGCGKTVSSLAILRLLATPPAHIVSGSIRFDGRELLDADFHEMRQIRGRDIAMVFQDPLASLDPTFTIGSQIAEAMRLHEKLSRKAARARAVELLQSVHIPDPARRLSAYPHQLSGGMRQRVMIAMALSCYPRLLIADEPTTALDVTIQAQIVELLHELCESQDLSVLFVTHDLALISELSDEIAVMYAGEVVEQAPTADLFARPRHPYTAALLAASPGVRLAAGPLGAAGRERAPSRSVPHRLPLPSALRVRRGRLPGPTHRPGGRRRGPPVPLPAQRRAGAARCRRQRSVPCRCRRDGRAMTVTTPSEPAATVPDESLVAELRDVSCHFTVRLPGRGKGTVHAMDDVDLAVGRGTTLGLVGESGSGKSTLARVLLRLIRADLGPGAARGRGHHAGQGGAPAHLAPEDAARLPGSLLLLRPAGHRRGQRGRGALRPHRARSSRARPAGGRAARPGPAARRLRPPPPPRALGWPAPARRHRAGAGHRARAAGARRAAQLTGRGDSGADGRAAR